MENVIKDINVNYFINNDSNGTAYFNYCMKHAFKKSISKNEL